MEHHNASKDSKKTLQVGGAVDPRKHIYIRRPQDEELFQHLKNGHYCNVLTSRQMGKTSAMAYAGARLARVGIASAVVELAGGLGKLPLQQWYKDFLSCVHGELCPKDDFDVKAWWAEHSDIGPNRRLHEYIRHVLVPRLDGPAVIFVDEIDATYELPFADDFFTAIRSIHNQRPQIAEFNQLSFCLLGVARPSELIRQRGITPYNIGVAIELRDFDFEADELSPFVELLARNGGPGVALLEAVFRWTNGHPFLTAQLVEMCVNKKCVSDGDVDELVRATYTSYTAVKGKPHFVDIDRYMVGRGDLDTLYLYRQIYQGDAVRDGVETSKARLKLSGLVKRQPDGTLAVRNPIYKHLYDQTWIRDEIRPHLRNTRLLKGIIIAVLCVLALAYGGYRWYEYTYLVPQKLAEKWSAQLSRTLNQTEADELYELLIGRRPDPATGRYLEGYKEHANDLYANFKDRLTTALLADADALVENKDIDGALVQAAVAVGKNQGVMPMRFQKIYQEKNYQYLATTLRGHTESVKDVVYNNDGRFLFTVSDDGTLRMWATHTGAQMGRAIPVGHQGGQIYKLNSVTISGPEDQSVIIVSSPEQGFIYRWILPEKLASSDDLVSLTPIRISPNRYGKVRHASLHPNGQILLTVEDQARIWDLSRGEPEEPRESQGHGVYHASYSPDGKHIGLAQLQGAELWRSDLRARIWSLRQESPVTRVLFSPDGGRILTTSLDGEVRLWDTADTSVPMVSYKPPSRGQDTSLTATGASFCSSGTYLATSIAGYTSEQSGDKYTSEQSGDSFGYTMIWDMEGNQGRSIFSEFPVFDVEVDPSCRFVASSGGSDVVRIWYLTEVVPDSEQRPQVWIKQLGMNLKER